MISPHSACLLIVLGTQVIGKPMPSIGDTWSTTASPPKTTASSEVSLPSTPSGGGHSPTTLHEAPPAMGKLENATATTTTTASTTTTATTNARRVSAESKVEPQPTTPDPSKLHCKSFICMITDFEMLKTGDGYILKRLSEVATAAPSKKVSPCKTFSCWINRFIVSKLSYGFQLRNKQSTSSATTTATTLPKSQTSASSTLTPSVGSNSASLPSGKPTSFPWQNVVDLWTTSHKEPTSSVPKEVGFYKSYLDYMHDEDQYLLDILSMAKSKQHHQSVIGGRENDSKPQQIESQESLL